jgi:hypothetical protein
MTKDIRILKLFPLAAAAVLSLAFIATMPVPSRAGCSHDVTSRALRVRLPSLMEPIASDRAAGASGQSAPYSIPPPARRCSGAWCTDIPGAPSAPARMLEWCAVGWAWPGLNWLGLTAARGFYSPRECSLRSVSCPFGILRPPRTLPAA